MTKRGRKISKRVNTKVVAHLRAKGYKLYKNRIPKRLLEDILKEYNATVNYLIQKYYDTYIFKGELPIEVIKKPDKFYKSKVWKDLRELVFSIFGRKCLCCGSKHQLHIDHVIPRSVNPELALKIKNLQPLCKECNTLKGTWTIDYRDENLHKSRKKLLEERRKK
ncbi:5-methylcytosine-specific restriction endonuclease [Vibrio phage vB_VpaM_R16F]|nr:5-methylcytosine-specific restriction endonuclease [Vibrio phage vB_VpaM_R16F]